MDSKSEEGIFLWYSTNSIAYRVYNSRTQVVMESINVVIDDLAQDKVPKVVPGAETYVETSAQEKQIPENVVESESYIGEAEKNNVETSKGPSTRVKKNCPQDLIIGDLEQGVRRSDEIVSNS